MVSKELKETVLALKASRPHRLNAAEKRAAIVELSEKLKDSAFFRRLPRIRNHELMRIFKFRGKQMIIKHCGFSESAHLHGAGYEDYFKFCDALKEKEARNYTLVPIPVHGRITSPDGKTYLIMEKMKTRNYKTAPKSLDDALEELGENASALASEARMKGTVIPDHYYHMFGLRKLTPRGKWLVTLPHDPDE